VVKRLVAIAALLTGCTVFEDPTVVLDLRVLAMTAEISEPLFPPSQMGPEQVVDVDLEMPMPAEILQQLQPTTICALVADPAQDRPLRWAMTVCLLEEDGGRCDRTLPFIELGAGIIQDPELATSAQRPCGSIEPAAYPSTLLALLREAVEANPVQALGGIDYTVMFTIGAVEDRSTDVYATKHLRISPRIPVDRLPNLNPRFDYIDAARQGGAAVMVPGDTNMNGNSSGRCGDPTVVPAPLFTGDRVTLFPVEPEGTREDYVVPTLDGKTAMLSETVSYQWFATYGSWSDEFTGGGRDVLGNQSLLGSDWIAPSAIAGESLVVSLWMIQRDERYGVSFFETCVEVFR